MTTTTISVSRDVSAATAVQRALIVEDEPGIGELLAQIIKRRGFKVYSARDGDEAVRLARAISPDLVTLDLNLPVKDGHSVLREFALDPRTSRIPVIVVSAHCGQLRPAGQVVGVLQKPFDIHELEDAITIATMH
ncbi:MAG TPA: response regulator [Chloroflexota bacterium]|nr:response regulator [Chloroflexota bacterium]